LEHVVRDDIRGIYNVAGDGVLAFTEVVGLLGKTYAPILPPWGTGLAAATLSRLGIRVPPEMLQQMRFGRGIDNRKLKATGFRYRYTTRETVLKLAEHQRLHPIVRGATEPYRYEREVEDFLRWSPHVRNPGYRKESRLTPGEMVDLQKVMASYGDRVGSPGGGSKREQSQAVVRAATGTTPTTPTPEAPAAQPKSAIRPRARRPQPSPKRAAARAAQNGGEAPVDHYDDLKADEIVTLIDSLEPGDLDALLEYERANRSRPRVVSAIEGARARRESGQPR
ncbi:MAG TPA: hypothetical protein VGD37_23645, partial [Kofleriaceae bacterium]